MSTDLGRLSWRATCFAVMVTTYVSISPLARAEYQLAPGDVIEIAAIGVPDLRHRATIDIDGRVSIPLLGNIKAAGLLVSELNANVRDKLPTKIFRRRTEDGREYPVVLTPDEITVNIAEYRPVYVNGDVAKPGAQAYRPDLTVRQAIALAGGFDVMRFKAQDPFLAASDFRGEYESLWIEYAKEQAHISRLRAELGEPRESDQHETEKIPVAPTVLARLKKIEVDQLNARNLDYDKEREYLGRAIKQEQRRISVLSAQHKKEQEDSDLDTAELEQTRVNLQKGLVAGPRVAEARRLTLISATRALQSTALIAQLEREEMELTRRLGRLDDRRRLELLGELEVAEMKLATLQSRLQAVGEKVIYAGLVRSQLVRGNGDEPDVSILRTTDSRGQKIPAGQETVLMPGDVVEVSVRAANHVASQ
jgi:polysaccharide biosynthesis/export protein